MPKGRALGGGDEVLQGKSLARKNVANALLRFALPVVMKSFLRRYCGVTSALVMNRYVNTKTLTTINSTCALVIFLVSILLKLTVNDNAIFSLRCNTKGRMTLHHDVFDSFMLVNVIALVLGMTIFV